MARQLGVGKPAKYKYNEVKYAHVKISLEDAVVLTSDPWSFLTSYIIENKKHSKGVKRRCFNRAIYYLDLANGFYRAAENAELPTKSTLSYYGMLNLVKSFLSTKRIEFGTKYEQHGLTLPIGSKYEVTVSYGSDPNTIYVFQEFANQLGTPITGKKNIHLRTICSQIPEIHEMACNFKNFTGGKRKFLPIEIEFLVNRERSKLFTEVGYEKKQETRIPYLNFLKGERRFYFRKGPEKEGWIVFRSVRKKNLTLNNWQRVYKNILKEYDRFNIVSALTRMGYRYYCDLSPGDYHHLCYSLMLMYYFGTISRYRPDSVEEILSGELRPLFAESVVLVPTQFLYHVLCLTTNRICVIPYTKLL